MDILRKLPTELCEKIYLMSIDTGHAKHIEEYWKRKKLKMLLENFENHFFYGPTLLKQNNKLQHRHIVYNYAEVKNRIGNRPYPLALAGHYHSAQEGSVIGTNTKFAQTSAITRPDQFDFNGFKIRSGFTLYEVKEQKIISSRFIPLNFP